VTRDIRKLSEDDLQATVIDLSMPPSVNSIWRYSRARKKAYLSPRYLTWKRDADNRFLANRKSWRPIKGPFKAAIVFSKKKRGKSDLDNRIKALFDALQRAEIIENDSLCESMNVSWGYAPEGCRVKLRAA
jgi:Holliday junction resolvase RusA-like endonuclease